MQLGLHTESADQNLLQEDLLHTRQGFLEEDNQQDLFQISKNKQIKYPSVEYDDRIVGFSALSINQSMYHIQLHLETAVEELLG